MSYNGKNYAEQGGDKWVIGGTLEINEGATVTGLPEGEAYSLPLASASVLGGVKAAAKGSGDTVPVKVDSAGNLYVPTYPSVPTIPKAPIRLIVWQQRWRPLLRILTACSPS